MISSFALLLLVTVAQAPDGRVPLEGRVLDRAGQPWSGANVVLVSHPTPYLATLPGVDRLTTVCDREGRFGAQVLEDRVYFAWAHAPADEQHDRVTSWEPRAMAGALVELKEDGESRLRTSVRFVGLDAWREHAPFVVRGEETMPDAVALGSDGTLTLPPLPDERISLYLFGADGYPIDDTSVALTASGRREIHEWHARRAAATGKDVSPDLDPVDAGPVERPVPPPALVDVRVVSRAGEPVAKAEIWFQLGPWTDLPLWRIVGRTDSDGRARIAMARGESSGLRGWMLARAPGFADESVEYWDAGEGGLTVRLTPGYTVSGRLLLGKDRPLADTTIVVSAPLAEGSGSRPSVQPYFVTTDASGRFALAGRDRRHGLRVTAVVPTPILQQLPHLQGRRVWPEIVLSAAVEPPASGDLDLGDLDLTSWPAVDIQVTKSGGAAAERAKLLLGEAPAGGDDDWWPPEPLQIRTGVQGNATLLLPSTAAMGVLAVTENDGFAVQRVTTPSGTGASTPIALVLANHLEVTGRVVNTEGKGLAKTRVSCSLWEHTGASDRALFEMLHRFEFCHAIPGEYMDTNEKGEFRVLVPFPATYRLRAYVPLDNGDSHTEERDVIVGSAVRDLLVRVDPESAKQERAARAEEERAREAKIAIDPATAATLEITVIGKTTHAPLSDVRVMLEPVDDRSFSNFHEDRSEGRLGEALVTGADGIVRYRLQPGRDYELSSFGDGDREVGQGELRITALAPLETRAVTLELSSEPDLEFHGCVMAAEDGRPLPEAVVKVRSSREREGVARTLRVDADGRFSLEARSWDQGYLLIEASGFAPARLSWLEGCDTRERAAILPLLRSAGLSVTLIDGKGATAVKARLSTDDYWLESIFFSPHSFGLADPEWIAVADAGGKLRFLELPPDTPFVVEILQDDKLVRRLPETLALRPGEHRDVAWSLASSTASEQLSAAQTRATTEGWMVRGLVRDQHGAPVVSTVLWLLPDTGNDLPFLRSYQGDEAFASATTDAQGAFTFVRVPSGRWLLGTAPPSSGPTSADPDLVASVTQVVEVSGADVDITLVADRGLYLRGKLLDQQGKPLDDKSVNAFSGVGWVDAETRDDGSFLLGPLSDTSYQVSADQAGTTLARPGDAEVVLRQMPFGRIEGTVVDGRTRKPCAAQVLLAPADGGSGIHWVWAGGDGSFSIDELEPGAYRLCAQAVSRMAGVSAPIVVAGTPVTGVVLPLEPAAAVRVRNVGNDLGQVEVRSAGVVVAGDGFVAGSSHRFVVPAGPVEIQLTQGGVARRESLELTVGREHEIEIGGDGWQGREGKIADQAAMDELLPRISERVAKLRGRPFRQPVPGKLVEPAELERQIKDDVEREYAPDEIHALEALYRHLRFLRPGESLRGWLESQHEGIAGLYEPQRKGLLCVRARSQEHLTLVHELVHAWQDQSFDLEAFDAGATTSDERDARKALVQGEAELISELYANQYAAEASTAAPAAGTSASTGWNLGGAEDQAFARAVFEARGLAGLDAAYAKPPASTEQVLHPQKYLEQSDLPVRIEPVDLAPTLGHDWRRLLRDTLGEATIALGASLAPATSEPQQGAVGWGGDQCEVFERAADGATLLVWRTTWDSEADAREFEQLARRWLTAPAPGKTSFGEVLVDRRGSDVIVFEGPLASLDRDLLLSRCWPLVRR